MTITKSDFTKYVRVQRMGRTNMLDIPVVSRLTGLTGEKVLEIIKNYGDLDDLYKT